jgi:hypothetical protein
MSWRKVLHQLSSANTCNRKFRVVIRVFTVCALSDAHPARHQNVHYMFETRIQVPRHAVPWRGRSPSSSPAVRWCLKKLVIPPLRPAAPVPGWYLMPAQYSVRYRLVLLNAVSTMRYLDSSVTRTAVMLAPGADALTTASSRDVLSTERVQRNR